MSKNFKQDLGSVGPALYDILSSIVQTNDLAAANQMKNFREVLALALKAKEAGVDIPTFLNLISVFRRERAAYLTGEIELAGAANTGLETADGNSLHIDLNAGGSLAGFSLGASAGYQQHKESTSFERSSSNFRILARWGVVPDDTPADLKNAIVAFVAKAAPDTPAATLPASFNSPVLEGIKDILPELMKALGTTAK